MTTTTGSQPLASLPLAPRNPMPRLQAAKALREFHTGMERLRDAGGPVTRIKLVPSWMAPELIVVTSPQGAHDVLGRPADVVERTRLHDELRASIGANLFVSRHEAWLPRRRMLQPLFTKKHVRDFAGHMAQSAETIAERWAAADRDIDLDVECRKLTMRALGRSVLGLDLDEEADRLAEPLQTVLRYIADRGLAPVNVPRWVPTRRNRRARKAAATLRALAGDVLDACRRDPDRDAPLVRALVDATDPQNGRRLTDDEIRDELIVFIAAGHDTTATTLAYALWQLGRHPELQQRVRAEVDALGRRELTPDDVPQLRYTVQVLHEALRLCPPGASNGREVMRDIEVDGHRVVAGSLITVGVYALQRDRRLWDRADEFDPDRFRPERAKLIDRWQYLPFGAGPRTCIGDHFAMLELALSLATIVRAVEIDSRAAEFPMETPFTMAAAAPIIAGVARRQTTENPGVSEERPVSDSRTDSPSPTSTAMRAASAAASASTTAG